MPTPTWWLQKGFCNHNHLSSPQVGSKSDAAPPAAADAFQQWASQELFPPKAQVLLSSNGHFDLAFLDAPRSGAAPLLLKARSHSSRARQQQQTKLHHQQAQQELPDSDRTASASTNAAAVEAPATGQLQEQSADAATFSKSSTQPPAPGQPQRVPGRAPGSSSGSGLSTLQHTSCGWVFDEGDLFDQGALLQLLTAISPAVARVKGVFRVEAKQWVMPAAEAATAGATADDTQQWAQAAGEGSSRPADAATGTTAGNGCPTSSSNSSGSSGDGVLCLQDVCYRGPSMMEVIMDDNAAQVASIAAALQNAGMPAARCLATKQQQEAGCVTDGLAQPEAIEARLQQVSLVQGTQQEGSAGGARTSCASTMQTGSAEDAWLLLEEAMRACLKP